MRAISILLLAAAAALPAGSDPAGFALWKSAQLKSYAKSLAPKMSDKKFAAETLAKYDNHLFMMSHREASGEAELHETQADLFIVESGEATLIVGGTVVDGKTTAPNEFRGPSISGGESKKLAAGDVVHIPAKTAHQLKLDDGKQFTYAILKITEK